MTIDCLFIGNNDVDFAGYEERMRSQGITSGAYRDLNLNFIHVDGKPYTVAEALNIPGFNGYPGPVKIAEEPVFSAAIAYLGSYLNRHGLNFEYVNSFSSGKEQLAQRLTGSEILTIAIITTFYVDMFPIIEIMDFIKQYNRTARVIVGGPFIFNRVRVLDLLLYGKVDLPCLNHRQLEFVRGDCRDETTIKEVLKDVDAVIHLGEIVGDPACAINESFTIETNYAATQMILEECMKSGIKRFVFSSSCSVYGYNDEIVHEGSACNPVSLYARCKIESEKAILSNGYASFCPTILRLATVHGQSYRQRFDLVVNLLTIRAVAEGRITIFGGQQWRPFISVLDICQGILLVLRSEGKCVKNQVFNLGDSRENYRMIEIGEALKSALPEIAVEVQQENVDPRNYRVNFDKVKNMLGFCAEYTISDTISDLVMAYRQKAMFHDHGEAKYHNYLSLK